MNNRMVKKKLDAIYQEQGYIQFRDFCFKAIERLDTKPNLSTDERLLKGQLGETFLLATLLEVQKALPYRTDVIQSLYVKDVKSDKVTELDVTFVTPYMVYLFECKSYKGSNKTLDKEGTLHSFKGIEVDVFSQSYLHAKLFYKRYGQHLNPEGRPIKLICFDFSKDEVKDLRDEENKQRLVICNRKNILTFLINDLKSRKKVVVNRKNLMADIRFDLKNYKLYRSQHHKQLRY